MSNAVKVVCRGESIWRIESSLIDCLLSQDEVNWFAPESCSSATLVKRGHHRSVWRIAMANGQTVFAKVFDDRGGSPFLVWRRWTHSTPAEREWRSLRALKARSLPVVRPLALGMLTRPHRRMVLLTEEVGDAVNLIQAWGKNKARFTLESKGSPTKQLIHTVARLWADSHDRGFAHPDGHPANVIVSSTSDGELEGAFTDVASGNSSVHWFRSSQPIGVRKALRSLAQLDQHFHRIATRPQRLRFWRHYWSLRATQPTHVDRPTTERRLLTRFHEVSMIHAAGLARQRDRRMRRDRKYFTRIGLPGDWRAVVTLRLERRHVFPEKHASDRTANEWREWFRSAIGNRSSLGDIACDPTVRCLRFFPRGLLDSAYQRIAGSLARRFFVRCHQLRHRDIAAPLALAYLERTNRWGFVLESMLVLPTDPLVNANANKGHSEASEE